MFVFVEEDNYLYTSHVFNTAYKHGQVRVVKYLIENYHEHNSDVIDQKMLSCLTRAGYFPGGRCLVDDCSDMSDNEGLCPSHVLAVASALDAIGIDRNARSVVMRMVTSGA